MSDIKTTASFKRQYKRVRKDKSWRIVFNGTVPLKDAKGRSPWQYIVDCFINDKKIPKYFYPHNIILSTKQIQQIKQRLGKTHVNVQGMDLHFDGHSGDHLLVYARTDAGLVYFIGIGSHSQLFR